MSVSRDLAARARNTAALVLDVDGVLTDASLFYDRRGEALKRFSARDGFAIVVAQELGLKVAVLSGRTAPPLAARLRDLHIPPELVIQGSRDKAQDITALAAGMDVPLDRVAFVGDDLPDLPALLCVGFAACPADAAPEVAARCHLVCRAAGGRGAVREVVETVLKAQGRWADVIATFVPGRPRAPSAVRGD